VGGAGEVEGRLGDQGTPDRPHGGLGSQPGRHVGVGGGQKGLELLVLGVQAGTRVAAFSVGVVPDEVSEQARAAGVRHYLAAGTLEPGFRRVTHQWAQHLQRAGLGCRYHEWIGGHDHLWWAQQLPAALEWLLTQP
jgi:hypothetical protein